MQRRGLLRIFLRSPKDRGDGQDSDMRLSCVRWTTQEKITPLPVNIGMMGFLGISFEFSLLLRTNRIAQKERGLCWQIWT